MLLVVVRYHTMLAPTCVAMEILLYEMVQHLVVVTYPITHTPLPVVMELLVPEVKV